MHETNLEGVKGNIDETLFINNIVYVRGWVFRENSGVCPLRTITNNTTITPVEVQPRQDVANFYQKPELAQCGWKTPVPTTTTTTSTSTTTTYLQIFYNETWYNVFSLDSNKYRELDTQINTSLSLNPPTFV